MWRFQINIWSKHKKIPSYVTLHSKQHFKTFTMTEQTIGYFKHLNTLKWMDFRAIQTFFKSTKNTWWIWSILKHCLFFDEFIINSLLIIDISTNFYNFFSNDSSGLRKSTWKCSSSSWKCISAKFNIFSLQYFEIL